MYPHPFQIEFGDGTSDARGPAPAAPRDGRQTIAWWQGRQQEINKKLESRKTGGTGIVGRSPGGTNVIVPKGLLGANGNGRGKAAGSAAASIEEDSGDEEEGAAAGANGNGNGRGAKGKAGAKVKDLLNVFGGRR
ncbi:hypothetical protein MNEG_12499 [Monoraphidium neglectum]|uniref:Uncharacterized protein n=1 Tax=Monoraphidium neglectum TaxID=145388 RepID=A0A0D2M1Z5_9CHLO|nr:hypothetical protein MNEG_12499 [Monoraphidium neglectum]KIY95461.1 hypothetical protein MNEG_12499 [Monoraphidium neglectum]|eukprot:XP_013894481.1 hypothetical protein MNEG_12499 [Monoraphidium neglectum]